MIQELNDSTFEKFIISSKIPVLVEFWAPWCSACNQSLPVLEKFANDNIHIIVAKVNVDQNPNLSKFYGIKGLPTLLLFNKGFVVKKQMGIGSKNNLDEFIKIVEYQRK